MTSDGVRIGRMAKEIPEIRVNELTGGMENQWIPGVDGKEFVQFERSWKPAYKTVSLPSEVTSHWVYDVPRGAHAIWGIRVRGNVSTVTLSGPTHDGPRAPNVFHWDNGTGPAKHEDIVIDACISTLKMGFVSMTLKVVSREEPRVTSIGVMYSDLDACVTEADRQCFLGYPPYSDCYHHAEQRMCFR